MTNRTETFNRADNYSAWGTPSDGGGAWTSIGDSANWNVVSNQGRVGSVTIGERANYLDAAASAVDVQVTIASGGDSMGVMARLSNISNFLLLEVSTFGASGAFKLLKRVSGTYTQLGSTYSGAIANGDVIKLRCTAANELTGYLNGTARIGPLTESAGSSNTYHGLRYYYQTNRVFEDFSITEITSGLPTLTAITASAITTSGATLTITA